MNQRMAMPNIQDELAPINALRQNLNRAMKGKAAVVEQVLACLLAHGHLLLEDMPGLGKTTLAKALAISIGGRFSRVQCTPDLLPGDVTGFSIFNQKTREFEFQAGPVFSEVLLADEINRTTPRTQSALLEAMAERQVTVDNQRRELSPSFFVIATQNPVEHHGTYPLPEAQLDRFAVKLSIGYPNREDEMNLLAEAIGSANEHATLQPALKPGQLTHLQTLVKNIVVAPALQGYLVDLGRATRADSRVPLGLSPRGLLIWQRVAQAWAFLQGRPFVVPEDIKFLAPSVLGVRLGLAPETLTNVLQHVFQTVPVPN